MSSLCHLSALDRSAPGTGSLCGSGCGLHTAEAVICCPVALLPCSATTCPGNVLKASSLDTSTLTHWPCTTALPQEWTMLAHQLNCVPPYVKPELCETHTWESARPPSRSMLLVLRAPSLSQHMRPQ